MNTKTTKPEQQHHYFASTALAWGTGPTRAAAIERAARGSGSDAIKRNVKANGGLYVWSTRVELPESATYDINNYAPSFLTNAGARSGQRVPMSNTIIGRIQNVKGHLIVEDADGSAD